MNEEIRNKLQKRAKELVNSTITITYTNNKTIKIQPLAVEAYYGNEDDWDNENFDCFDKLMDDYKKVYLKEKSNYCQNKPQAIYFSNYCMIAPRIDYVENDTNDDKNHISYLIKLALVDDELCIQTKIYYKLAEKFHFNNKSGTIDNCITIEHRDIGKGEIILDKKIGLTEDNNGKMFNEKLAAFVNYDKLSDYHNKLPDKSFKKYNGNIYEKKYKRIRTAIRKTENRK